MPVLVLEPVTGASTGQLYRLGASAGAGVIFNRQLGNGLNPQNLTQQKANLLSEEGYVL